ncbi:MAG: transposase [Acidimicrobiales bacterium]
MYTMTHNLLDENTKADEAANTTDPNVQVPERSPGRRQYSAKYKAKILAEYETLDRDARGALLRREGLYSSLINRWRRQRDSGAYESLAKRAGRQPGDPRGREITRLKRRIERLELDLSKAHKIIEVQGKLSVLLEQLATDGTQQERGEMR